MAKNKRKGLMELLTEYQNEKYHSKAGQRGLTKDGDSKADIAEARKRQAEVRAQAAKKEEKKDPPAARPAARRTPTTTQRKDPPKSTEKSTTRTLYEGGNVGTGRDGRFGTGTFGRGRPTEGKEVEKRNRRGRVTGTKRQLPKKEEKKMTAAERRRMRLRARRGR
tara:strand:- start:747 stop:1241 length:495 start_codon:yes stop_codon:yes gene_type:complete